MNRSDLGLDPDQLRELVIRPTLKHLDLWSLASENLVLGTAIVESKLKAIKQYGTGPALGLWQMEPFTHNDIWRTHLIGRPLGDKVRSFVPVSFGVPSPSHLMTSLQYGAAMCRIHYLRVRAPLPAPNDALGMAKYWKDYYNTRLGKGTVEKALPAFRFAMESIDEHSY